MRAIITVQKQGEAFIFTHRFNTGGKEIVQSGQFYRATCYELVDTVTGKVERINGQAVFRDLRFCIETLASRSGSQSRFVIREFAAYVCD